MTDVERRTELLNYAEAARAVKVSPRTIRRWVSSGRLRAYRLGRRIVRVDRFDLESLIRAGKS